tara:strand:- start:2568 stop:4688 length:2121 start_codon:yes stop_codon:yes gene_type:complete
MKLLFENWRKHLKEGLLTEFDKADRSAVMADADRFTVSYEIELETDENISGEPGGIDLERARSYIGEDYFYDTTNEREASDFFDYTISVEPREDEFVAWYLEQIEEAETPNYIDSVLLGLAAETSDEHKKDLLDILKQLFNPNSELYRKAAKVIADNFTEEELVRYKVGKPRRVGQQGTLGLDGEAGVEEIVEVNVTAFVKQLLFDYDNIGKGGTLPQYPKADYGFQGFMDDLEMTDEIADIIEAGREYLEDEIATGGGERYATLGDLTNTYQYKTPIARDIAVQLSNAVEADIEKAVEEQYQEYQEDPIDYLENMGFEMEQFERQDEDEFDPRELLTEAFPNFMAEYEDQLKFEKDLSLANGIEFSMDDPIYMTGLDEAFKFLQLFFDDYNKQDTFRFDTTTGLHTNIGYLDEDGDEITDYNLIKTMLFLNNDFAFKGFENRKGARWAGDLKAIFKREIEDQLDSPAKSTYGFNEWKDSIFDLYKEGKFDELEKKLSSLVNYFAPSNPKSIGFNLHYIGNRGYVEFRYPGGDSPTLEKMKSATLYYAHLIKLAVDKNYKRKEFLKKLVKMMVNLKDIRKRKVNIKETFAGMKKGKLYRIPVDYDENGLYNLVMTTEDLPSELQTLSLFIRRNAAPGVFKGLRKKDGKMFPVFEIIGAAGFGGKMSEKIFSLEDFAFFKKSGSIEGMGKTSTNFKAYNYFRNKIKG